MAEKRCNRLDTVTLVVFIAFVAVLLLLTLDHFLGFGIVRPKLDRQLLREISQLADPNLPAEQRDALEQDIVSYHEFSVPLLIESIEKNKPGVREPAAKCLQEIARAYFGSDIASLGADPAKLKEWWRTIRERLSGQPRH